MSNQPPPPSRPWSRLARPAVPPAVTPAPQPAPPATMPIPPPVGSPPLRPAVILPTFVRRTAVPEPTSRPPPPTRAPLTLPGTTPSPQPQPLPTVPVPRLPAPPPIASIKLPPPIPVIETLAPAPALPSASALISETKPSPKIFKSLDSPLLPLDLPPLQIKGPDKDVHPGIPLEAEQKNVLFQKSKATLKRTNGNGDTIHSVWAQKPSVAATTVKGVSDVVPTKGTGNGIIAKKKAEPGEVEVIMIAGENKGAMMELASSTKNHYHKIGNNASSGSSSDEGKHRRQDKGRNGKAPATASLPTAMYTNSNVQCVNNSILCNSSCTNHDPGVHLSLTRKPADGVFTHMKEHKAA